MSEKKSKKKENNEQQEVEKLLDTLWGNLASRRSCEKTHTPEYLKAREKK